MNDNFDINMYEKLKTQVDEYLMELSKGDIPKEFLEKKSFLEAVTIYHKLYEDTGKDCFHEAWQKLLKNGMIVFNQNNVIKETKPRYYNRTPEDMAECAIVLGCYDILANEDDEILLGTKWLGDDDSSSPIIYYDGGKHALFFKNDSNIIVCDYINRNVRKIFYACKEILVCENYSDELRRAHENLETDDISEEMDFDIKEYMVPLQKVKKREIEKLAEKIMKYV